MAVQKIAHPSGEDREAEGLEARYRTALSSHTNWQPAEDRPDPCRSAVPAPAYGRIGLGGMGKR
jgi:hypothetical protein